MCHATRVGGPSPRCLDRAGTRWGTPCCAGGGGARHRSWGAAAVPGAPSARGAFADPPRMGDVPRHRRSAARPLWLPPHAEASVQEKNQRGDGFRGQGGRRGTGVHEGTASGDGAGGSQAKPQPWWGHQGSTLDFPTAGRCGVMAAPLRRVGTVPVPGEPPPPGAVAQPVSPAAPSHPGPRPCPVPAAPQPPCARPGGQAGGCAAAGATPAGDHAGATGVLAAAGGRAASSRGWGRHSSRGRGLGAPGRGTGAQLESQRCFPRKGGNAARRPLAPAAAPRAHQPRLQHRAPPPAAPSSGHTRPPRATTPGHAFTGLGDAAPPRGSGHGSPPPPQRTDGRTDGSERRVLIEKETYSLLWLAGPCPARVTFSSTAVRLAG